MSGLLRGHSALSYPTKLECEIYEIYYRIFPPITRVSLTCNENSDDLTFLQKIIKLTVLEALRSLECPWLCRKGLLRVGKLAFANGERLWNRLFWRSKRRKNRILIILCVLVRSDKSALGFKQHMLNGWGKFALKESLSHAIQMIRSQTRSNFKYDISNKENFGKRPSSEWKTSCVVDKLPYNLTTEMGKSGLFTHVLLCRSK